eukprot:14454483-Alexandrium_andersonii.AAC.1
MRPPRSWWRGGNAPLVRPCASAMVAAKARCHCAVFCVSVVRAVWRHGVARLEPCLTLRRRQAQ